MKLDFTRKMSTALIVFFLLATNSISAQNNSSRNVTQELTLQEFNFVTKTFWDLIASGGVNREQALKLQPNLKITEMLTYNRTNKGLPTGFVFFQIKKNDTKVGTLMQIWEGKKKAFQLFLNARSKKSFIDEFNLEQIKRISRIKDEAYLTRVLYASTFANIPKVNK